MITDMTTNTTDNVVQNIDDYKGRRVWVTGGAGVIGHELVARLADAGAKVWVTDIKPRPGGFPVRVRYSEGDANDLTLAKVRAFKPEVLFHLAATFERSVESPGFWDENFQHNLRLSHHVMSLARDAGTVSRVVFASSYLCYDPRLYTFPTPQDNPVTLTEETPLYPRNICGGAKLMHELELRFLMDTTSDGQGEGSELSAVFPRIFRSYGCGSRDVVSRWVRQLVDDEKSTLSVFGTGGIFDYIYAGDVAEGLWRLGLSDFKGPINLGSGQGRRVSDILDGLRKNISRHANPGRTHRGGGRSPCGGLRVAGEGHRLATQRRFGRGTG